MHSVIGTWRSICSWMRFPSFLLLVKYCLKTSFWFAFFHICISRSPDVSVFSPNAGKYGPEKLQVWSPFTQCLIVVCVSPHVILSFYLFYWGKNRVLSAIFWSVNLLKLQRKSDRMSTPHLTHKTNYFPNNQP